MRSTGGKVEIGAVIADMVNIYRTNFPALIGSAAVVFVIIGVLQAALYLDGNFVLVLIGSIAGLVGTTLYTGFVVKLVEDLRDGKVDSTIADLFTSAAPAVGGLIVNGVIKAVAVVIGLIFLIAPGLWLLTIWAVTAPVIVIERVGAIGAFSRSADLVRGRGWDVFGVIVVAFVISIVINAIFSAIGSPLGDLGQIVLGTVGSIFAAPIAALVASILYFQLAEGAPAGAAVAEAPPPPAVAG